MKDEIVNCTANFSTARIHDIVRFSVILLMNMKIEEHLLIYQHGWDMNWSE